MSRGSEAEGALQSEIGEALQKVVDSGQLAGAATLVWRAGVGGYDAALRICRPG